MAAIFFKMAATHRCTAGVQADKQILIGGPLGYIAHIVCIPPPPGGSHPISWPTVYSLNCLDISTDKLSVRFLVSSKYRRMSEEYAARFWPI